MSVYAFTVTFRFVSLQFYNFIPVVLDRIHYALVVRMTIYGIMGILPCIDSQLYIMSSKMLANATYNIFT